MTTKRFKIFQKIAQAQTPDATDPTTTSQAPTTIPGSPTSVTVDLFPTFTRAWGSNFKTPVNELLDTLNWAIYSLTAGQLDFYKLKAGNFNTVATKYDPFANAVISFSKSVYIQLLNGGAAFTHEVTDKKTPISDLYKEINSNSKIPDTLNNIFPQSFLQTKIGNFKPKVISILIQMNSLAGTQ